MLLTAKQMFSFCWQTRQSCEYGIYETVKARLWPWRSSESPWNLFGCSLSSRQRYLREIVDTLLSGQKTILKIRIILPVANRLRSVLKAGEVIVKGGAAEERLDRQSLARRACLAAAPSSLNLELGLTK